MYYVYTFITTAHGETVTMCPRSKGYRTLDSAIQAVKRYKVGYVKKYGEKIPAYIKLN